MPSADDGPAHDPAGCRTGGGIGPLPTFTAIRLSSEPPSCTPAASPCLRRRLSTWPSDQPYDLATKTFPRTYRERALHPAQICQLRAGGYVTRLQALVPLVRLLNSLAGPVPSGSTDTSRRCQGCLPPSRASPRSGCPQLHQPAATGQRQGPLIPALNSGASWRTSTYTHSPHVPCIARSTCGVRAVCGAVYLSRIPLDIAALPHYLLPRYRVSWYRSLIGELRHSLGTSRAPYWRCWPRIQNSLPSGSANTTHDCSPCPISTRFAP